MKNNYQYTTQKKEFITTSALAKNEKTLPEILIITSYPPRECGIATYSQDLIFALNNKFIKSFDLTICALESQFDKHNYTEEVKYVLETDSKASYTQLAESINNNTNISIVLIQHEFGLFKTNEADFIQLLKTIHKPIIIVFHTVLPNPNEQLQKMIQNINTSVNSFVVMTNNSSEILQNEYQISAHKISVIPHGTHLVEHTNKDVLKEKYQVAGRKVISTFGLLSSGKCIETSINALRPIVKKHPEVLFLVIGKTHPNVIKNEGEKYRKNLEDRINALQVNNNVQFINHYLPLSELLEYLQLTDIYLFIYF